MKVVVAGSRNITDYDFVVRAIAESGFTPTMVIEGGQRTRDKEPGAFIGGVDYHAMRWARQNKIMHRCFRANWFAHGKAAGPIRNRKMAEMGDALIAIPWGESKGTRNMILAMRLLNKPIFIREYPEPEISIKQGSS